MRDTRPSALDRYHELLRARSPRERLAQSARLTLAVRELAMAGLRLRHPGASDEELRVRLVVRLYGREAAKRWLSGVPDDAV